jgi:hypothetical protein
MQSSNNDKPCTALPFPAANSASHVNATVSKRHGVAGDLGGSGNLGTGDSIRFVSCSLMPLSMMSAHLPIPSKPSEPINILEKAAD